MVMTNYVLVLHCTHCFKIPCVSHISSFNLSTEIVYYDGAYQIFMSNPFALEPLHSRTDLSGHVEQYILPLHQFCVLFQVVIQGTCNGIAHLD